MSEQGHIYLTTEQFAARWQVSVRTAKGWIAAGMPSVSLGPGCARRIDPTEADAWVKAGGVQARTRVRRARRPGWMSRVA